MNGNGGASEEVSADPGLDDRHKVSEASSGETLGAGERQKT